MYLKVLVTDWFQIGKKKKKVLGINTCATRGMYWAGREAELKALLMSVSTDLMVSSVGVSWVGPICPRVYKTVIINV